MNQEQIREFYEKNFYYILLAGVGIGLLFGLVPLVLGIKRKKRNLGIIAFVSCGVIGGFAPILSIVVAAAFACWIFFSSRHPSEVAVTNEEPINVNPRDDQ